MIQQVFKAYGLESTVDDSVRPTQIRLDLDDAGFEQAARVLGMATNSFYVPLDAHRVLVAVDTPRKPPAVPAPGIGDRLSAGVERDRTDRGGQPGQERLRGSESVAEPSAGTLTIRAPESTLNAFNATMRELLDGRNQVLLEVRMIQLAHTGERNTGVQPPQTISAFNVYCRGAVHPERQPEPGAADHLLGAGRPRRHAGDSRHSAGLRPGFQFPVLQRHRSLWRRAYAIRVGSGRGLANLNLNSSDSRELDQIQLRLGDGEAGTLRAGTRYPIQTSSYSGVTASVANIPGLTGAGSSSSLSSLLALANSATPSVPRWSTRTWA